MKRVIIFTMVIAMMAATTTAAMAGINEIGKGPSIGLQHFGPTSGISLRYPVGYGLVLQPVVGVGMRAEAEKVSGAMTYAGRVYYEFDRPGWSIVPYTGLGVGMSQRYVTENGVSTRKDSVGYQMFFGAEYRRFRLAPALEYGLGYSENSDGRYYAGSFINVGLHYYF